MRQQVKITWLGHSTTLVSTPNNRTILIDPWLEDNPSCPEKYQTIDALDAVLLSHGHFDHVGSAVDLIQEHQPETVANFEVGTWIEQQGAENAVPVNEGGTYHLEEPNVDVTAVHAQHSSAILDEDENLIPGGNPMGWVMEFSDGKTVYHSGDTNVFGDMEMIGQLYQPDLALLSIGDHFTMGPREAAHAVELLDVEYVVPIHYGTFDALSGTPEELKDHLSPEKAESVTAIDPGDSVELK